MNCYKHDKDYNCEIIKIEDIQKIQSLSKDYIYNEKIGDIIKPFFDIDIKDQKKKPIQYEKYYTYLFKLLYPNGKIAVSSSHGKNISFHFVINGYETNLTDLNNFIQNHPILSIDDNIDKTVYTKRPPHYKVNFLGHDKISLRLLYSYKSHEDKRIKYPNNYHNDLSKHIVSLI